MPESVIREELESLNMNVQEVMQLRSALDTRSVTADTRTGESRVGVPTSPVDVLPLGDSLSAVAAGATTKRNTVVV
jgi:hypothetical protein